MKLKEYRSLHDSTLIMIYESDSENLIILKETIVMTKYNYYIICYIKAKIKAWKCKQEIKKMKKVIKERNLKL